MAGLANRPVPVHHAPAMTPTESPPRLRLLLCIPWLLLVVILVSTLAVNLWMRAAAADAIHDSAETLPARPVAIVPGASVHADGTPSGALEGRLRAALSLYERGKVERILVSGVAEDLHYDEVAGMAGWLDARDVAGDDLVLDRHGVRTLDTMIRAADVFGVGAAVVCTQRYHLPRSIFLARHAGIDAAGLVADPERSRARFEDEAREYLARVRAFLDVHLLGTRPRRDG
ncbi:MAG: SanA/YdcF family protein [Myxococcota bacterium]